MRIALIADLHGNETALRAVLADSEREGADQVICLGDVATLGPSPAATIEILRELGCPCIMGNHDEFLLRPELISSYPTAPQVVEAVSWCSDQLSEEDLAFLRGFEPRLSVDLGDGRKALLFHGSPASHTENLLATTPPEELDRALEGYEAEVMAGGHTHVQMVRQHRGILLVNVGSVGLPFREFVSGTQPTLLPHAEYAILESEGGRLSVDLRRVPFDLAAQREIVAASDHPMREWLMEEM